jgi:hypothetical protein
MRKKYLAKSTETSGSEPPRRIIISPPLEIHLSRSAEQFECIQLKEPELVFGENQRCPDPRTGLAAYGPYNISGASGGGQLRVGIVGTGEGIETALSLLEDISKPIEQDPRLDSILHPSFPGLNSGKPFSVDIVTQSSWHRTVNAQMIRLVADCDDPIAKYGMLRELFGAQVRTLTTVEFPPNIVICAIPAQVERSLVIASCLQSLPIEIIRHGKNPDAEGQLEDKATPAWNLSVRLLHKASLTPWRLADARVDSCSIGINFCRDAACASANNWTSFAHMVTDFGRGFILKGDSFEWKAKDDKENTPHLDQGQAARLMSRILDVYGKNVGNPVRKVVVHKTSPYSGAERAGFGDSLRGIKQHALVSVGGTGVFFIRPGRKPVFRGAAIPFGEKLGVVYLSGYTPFLKCYPGTRMPQPFEITENWGTLSFQEAAKDLLRLTKLNWSNSVFSADVPATLMFPTQAFDIFKILGDEDVVLDDRSYL